MTVAVDSDMPDTGLSRLARNLFLALPEDDRPQVIAAVAKTALSGHPNNGEEEFSALYLLVNLLKKVSSQAADSIIVEYLRNYLERCDRIQFGNLTLLLSYGPIQTVFLDYAIDTADNSIKSLCKRLDVLKYLSENAISGYASKLPGFKLRIWRSITAALKEEQLAHRYRACLLWSQWVDTCNHLQPWQDLLGSPSYWESLRLVLQSSDRPTQKICLRILRQSMSLLTVDIVTETLRFSEKERGSYLVAYDRYCYLFETIIFGHYVNQVEECLKSVSSILMSTNEPEKQPVVAYAWWVTLFASALDKDSDDQTRNLVGNWILSQRCQSQLDVTVPKMVVHRSSYSQFLVNSFLPWAAQGYQFSRSICRDDRKVWCAHGDSITRFFGRLWGSCCGSTSLKTHYLLSCLEWLYRAGDTVSPHAQWYILHSLQEAEAPAVYGTDVAKTALSIFQQNHRSSIQQLRIAQACRSFCGPLRQLPEWQQLQDAVTRLSKELDFDMWDMPPAYSIASSICRDRSTLRGNRLGPACKALLAALDDCPKKQNSTLPECIFDALQSVWSECEIQGFPRSTVRLLPRLIFHHVLLVAAFDDPLLADFLNRTLKDLQLMARARIYIWNPLAFAVRAAVMFYLCDSRASIALGPVHEHPSLLFKFELVPSIASMLKWETFVVEFLNSPPSPRLEFLLDSAVEHATSIKSADDIADNAMGRYCIADETLGHASVFDIIYQIGSVAPWKLSNLLLLVIKPWLHQKQPIPVVSKWKSTAQLQAMVIMVEALSKTISKPTVLDEYQKSFLKILAIEPLPRYRYLLEWIVITLTFRMIELGQYSAECCTVLAQLDTSGDQGNPKYLCSLMKVAVSICKNPSSGAPYAVRLFKHLVALSASPRVAVRHEAQWNVPVIWQHAESRNWVSITADEVLGSLCGFIQGLDKFRNPPIARLLENFEPSTDKNSRNLFEGSYLKLDPPEAALLTSRDFKEVRNQEVETNTLEAATLPLGPDKLDKADDHTITSQLFKGTIDVGDQNELSTPGIASFQTKGHDNRLRVGSGGAFGTTNGGNSLHTSHHWSDEPRMVLIATLIDTPVNLGGICRVSEIFGVQCLHIPNLQVVKNSQFQTTSVSSHGHVSMVETPPPQLRAVLRDYKRQGYVVVGIEQTSDSYVLGAEESKGGRKLPVKAVFVLGAERTGIPGDILVELDQSTEISQWGVTRSLNVQTAAAVVLWQWRREWSP